MHWDRSSGMIWDLQGKGTIFILTKSILYPWATAARFEAAYAFIFSSSSTSFLQQLLFIFLFPCSGGAPVSEIQPIYRQLYPLATVVRFEAAYAFIVSSSSTNSLHLHLLFSQLWGSPGIGNPGDLHFQHLLFIFNNFSSSSSFPALGETRDRISSRSTGSSTP